ncbi:hypothetical protein ASF28_02925 [Methylobacterium sp. Leaf99]|uniref:hypothetical protein n=1 Tax=Methylobacterium sp. Leaf99 TaxID=1736251 RepID=UPI0006F75D8F|nr:hypothetical protein [Methylobacterium sp. Leaf99]KQP10126.1 hypothetical protein ASF28_02925 [Methylobacterium sp. Leaf99]
MRLGLRILSLGFVGALLTANASAAPATRKEGREADTALRIIRQHRLVPKELRRCFFIMRGGHSTGHVVVFDVREQHRPPRCKGDPGTAPRMFSLEVDLRTGRARWDRMTPEDLDGGMRPIPRRARH